MEVDEPLMDIDPLLFGAIDLLGAVLIKLSPPASELTPTMTTNGAGGGENTPAAGVEATGLPATDVALGPDKAVVGFTAALIVETAPPELHPLSTILKLPDPPALLDAAWHVGGVTTPENLITSAFEACNEADAINASSIKLWYICIEIPII